MKRCEPPLGRINGTQSLGAVDGPGLRFVVFMQGCALRCAYCHNPDTWELEGGEVVSVDDLMVRIRRTLPYQRGKGGVTVSGGEPLLQAPFVAALFEACHREGIHTCLDTSGTVFNDEVEALLTVTDLVLLDLKATTEQKYRALGAGSLAAPLHFLQQLEARSLPCWIRQVIVPGVNDTAADIAALNALIDPNACVKKVELLPFHRLCVEKYDRLGLHFPLRDTPPMDKAACEALAAGLRPRE